MNQLAALNANADSAKLGELRDFVRTVDRDLQRTFPFEVESVRASGNPEKKGTYYVRGSSIVFNRWSLDLGGFRERVLPGAVDDVLATDPHVLHLWDHKTTHLLSSTRNGTLKLSADRERMHYDSEVAPTSYAADLRVLLERGDIDQSSFAFTVPDDGSGEEWRVAADGVVERDIIKIDQLFDVTTCAMGAYPATTASVAVRTLANKPTGRPTVGADQLAAPLAVDEPKEVAPAEPAGTPRAHDQGAAATSAEIARLKRDSEAALLIARKRLFRGRNELNE